MEGRQANNKFVLALLTASFPLLFFVFSGKGRISNFFKSFFNFQTQLPPTSEKDELPNNGDDSKKQSSSVALNSNNNEDKKKEEKNENVKQQNNESKDVKSKVEKKEEKEEKEEEKKSYPKFTNFKLAIDFFADFLKQISDKKLDFSTSSLQNKINNEEGEEKEEIERTKNEFLKQTAAYFDLQIFYSYFEFLQILSQNSDTIPIFFSIPLLSQSILFFLPLFAFTYFDFFPSNEKSHINNDDNNNGKNENNCNIPDFPTHSSLLNHKIVEFYRTFLPSPLNACFYISQFNANDNNNNHLQNNVNQNEGKNENITSLQINEIQRKILFIFSNLSINSENFFDTFLSSQSAWCCYIRNFIISSLREFHYFPFSTDILQIIINQSTSSSGISWIFDNEVIGELFRISEEVLFSLRFQIKSTNSISDHQLIDKNQIIQNLHILLQISKIFANLSIDRNGKLLFSDYYFTSNDGRRRSLSSSSSSMDDNNSSLVLKKSLFENLREGDLEISVEGENDDNFDPVFLSFLVNNFEFFVPRLLKQIDSNINVASGHLDGDKVLATIVDLESQIVLRCYRVYTNMREFVESANQTKLDSFIENLRSMKSTFSNFSIIN